VRVPEGVEIGNAKVTLSFPAWKAEEVAPATFEVLVLEPQKK
jgi:hypothetical protein